VTEIDELLAELPRRLADKDYRPDLVKKFDRIFADMDRIFADIQRRLDVIEKSRSVLAHQPPRPALTSWSATGLAAALAKMSPAELEKLRQ
jgi:hypothetical protein